MKTYTVLYAEEVPHYTTHFIEAESDEEALELAKTFDWSGLPSDPDHHCAVLRRIVYIQNDETDEDIDEDIALDTYFLGDGGERQWRVCDAAPALLAALRDIAAIPLWGEPLPDSMSELKSDLIEGHEYDAENETYTPCVDTESSYLQYAVETARAAIAKIDGTKTDGNVP